MKIQACRCIDMRTCISPSTDNSNETCVDKNVDSFRTSSNSKMKKTHAVIKAIRLIRSAHICKDKCMRTGVRADMRMDAAFIDHVCQRTSRL